MRQTRLTTLIASLLFACGLGLSSCGQKGPLTMPQDDQQGSQQSR